MKTNILTFHFARNYGAVLQCYALQRFIQQRGGEACVEDYRPASVASDYKVFDIGKCVGKTPSKCFHKTRRHLSSLGVRKRRFAAFEDFVKANLNLVGCGSPCDLRIVGSDQVWSPVLTKGFDPEYWNERPSDARVVSYAASIGRSLEHYTADDLAAHLFRFDAVSFRERSACEALCAALKLDAAVCCDPVFLLSKDEWTSLCAGAQPASEEPYLLFYRLKGAEDALELARKEAQAKGLRLIVLSGSTEEYSTPQYDSAGPAEFLSLLLGATEVVTTSFHGTALSVLLEKEFISVPTGDGRDSRIADMLETLGLSGRFTRDAACLAPIDWASVAQKIEGMIAPSIEYLEKQGI